MHHETASVHAGKEHRDGSANLPIHNASTTVFYTLESYEAAAATIANKGASVYGRIGNPSAHAFETAMADMEGGWGSASFSSGLSAISACLLAFLNAGDHVLMVDTVYGPVRRFCDNHLKRLGIETTYYDPMIGAAIETLIRPTTRLVYLESPGSQTFEVQDTPAICALAKARGIPTLLDNTWATPIFCQPLKLGVDIVVHAATKYIAGHSDTSLGVAVFATQSLYDVMKRFTLDSGACAAPFALSQGLRGLRSLDVRLHRHAENGRIVRAWLSDRPEVSRILSPAEPDSAGHAFWKRDFTGASGLFSILLDRAYPKPALSAFIKGLQYFPLGYSWGGDKSLMMPLHLGAERAATCWPHAQTGLRLSIGLEHPDDLIADLEAGFTRLRGAGL